MGITVTSVLSVSGNASATQPGNATTDASSADFAALLFGQLSNLAAPATTAVATSINDSKSDKTTENTADTALSEPSVTDPALAYLIATPAAGPLASKLASPDQATESINTNITPTSGQALTGTEAGQTAKQQQNTSASSILQNFAAKLENLSGNDTPGAAANLAADTLPQLPTGQESALAASANQTKAPAQASDSTEISTPLHSTSWAQNFSEKIVWLAKSDQQTAQININPPQLGPLQITLQMNGDQASAVFASPHAEVRQAIENSLPQLREMLSAAGINLGQADVGANLAQQNREAPSQSMNGNRLANENAILPGDGNVGDNKTSTPLQRGRGLVDLFA